MIVYSILYHILIRLSNLFSITTLAVYIPQAKAWGFDGRALKVTVKESVPFFHYTLFAVIGTFEIIGAIMIRYTLIRDKLIKQGLEQGREERREETYKEWYADWEKRKQDATEKGLEFNDPPPPRPSNNHR